MKIIDRFKASILQHGRGDSEPPHAVDFHLSTQGGMIAVSHDFSIYYRVDDHVPCQLSSPRPGDEFALTLVHSPSGSGKTTLLRELYAHIHRHAGSSNLNFDFHPDYTDDSRLACGFVPQHPPLVKHWKCSSLLPTTPRFLNVMFPEFSRPEQQSLPSRRLGELSGGQARRLLACSALEGLCSNYDGSAAFLLLDETFDGIGAPALVDCLKGLRDSWSMHANSPLHVLLVSHLGLTEVGDCLIGNDLVVAMEVRERSADRLETMLRNTQW